MRNGSFYSKYAEILENKLLIFVTNDTDAQVSYIIKHKKS